MLVPSYFVPPCKNYIFYKEVNTLKMWEWPNGAKHVFGGVRLIWGLHVPGNRDKWHAAAIASIVKLLKVSGGFTWHFSGRLYAVVPRKWANQIYEIMLATRRSVLPTRPRDKMEEASNIVALIAAGCGDYTATEALELKYAKTTLVPPELEIQVRYVKSDQIAVLAANNDFLFMKTYRGFKNKLKEKNEDDSEDDAEDEGSSRSLYT